MFYDVFKKICDERGISVTKATEEIGLARTIGSKWKKTGATPNGETLTKIADYFGITVDELVGPKDNEQAKKISPTPQKGIELNPKYFNLSPENRELVDALILKLSKSQSET